MKKSTLQLSLVMGTVALLLTACGGGNTTSQNMPVGGTSFTGIFTPGIGNLTSGTTANTCSTVNAQTETLTFSVSESGPTQFLDPSYTSALQIPVFFGSFVNPINQNNPCLTGTVNYSGCGNAQSGSIKFNACSLYLSGNQYQFNAVYYLYTSGGQLIQTGTVSATK